jgi:hypothetical protein
MASKALCTLKLGCTRAHFELIRPLNNGQRGGCSRTDLARAMAGSAISTALYPRKADLVLRRGERQLRATMYGPAVRYKMDFQDR